MTPFLPKFRAMETSFSQGILMLFVILLLQRARGHTEQRGRFTGERLCIFMMIVLKPNTAWAALV